MSTRKGNESIVYRSVAAGELEIDAQGRVWRVAKRTADRWNGGTRTNPCKRVRAEIAIPLGYLQVRVMIEGRRYYVMAHRLVWLHIHGAITPELTINHKNGDKHDNRPSNLELVTMSENRRHALDVLNVNRNRPKGSKHPKTHITEADALEIRRLRNQGRQVKEIAAAYGMRPKAVSAICCRRTWTHV